MKQLNEQIAANFVIQAKKLDYFTGLLHKILPVECRNHVAVANIRQKTLVLVTDSPVWTTRLRQLGPQIIKYINDSAALNTATKNANRAQPVLYHVQIQTRYRSADSNRQPSSKRKRKTPTISQKTAELLAQSASSIDDRKLKAALLKIARHGTTAADEQPGITPE